MAAAWAVLGSACLHVGYFLALQHGYRVGDLSVVYPLARGGGPALATIGAILWFGERPSAWALTGTALVVLGATILATARRPRSGIAHRPGAALGRDHRRVHRDVHAVGRPRRRPRRRPPAAVPVVERTRPRGAAGPAALARRADVAHVVRHHRGAVLAVATLSPLAYLAWC
jgi:multidrug transporter EmrE-like cation transporter